MQFFIKTSAILLSLSLLCGCSRDKKTLVMAEVNPPDSVAGQMDAYFANEAKRLSGGTILIEVNTSAILGDENTVINEMMTTKKIDLARISLFSLSSSGSEKSSMLTIPYTFNDREHFWKFAKSDLASEILNDSNSRGLKGLFLAEEGFRHFFSTKPLNSIEDLSGVKIRTTSDPVLTSMIHDLGSEAVFVPFYDIIKEMIVGTVDAAEQPIVNYKSNLFDSAAPNMILDGHTIGIIEVVITNNAWDGLNHMQQQALMQASENAAIFCRGICENREKLTIESLKASGINIVDVKDKTPWKKVCSQTIERRAQRDIEFYNKIVEMGK